MVQIKALLCVLALYVCTGTASKVTYMYCNKKGADCGWYYMTDQLCSNLRGTPADKQLDGNYRGCQFIDPESNGLPAPSLKFLNWCTKDGKWDSCSADDYASAQAKCRKGSRCSS
ncbi:hypothetical protein BGW37DRAFT_468318 [Umbelopsis sp. PMI_123]|nr:hypothetical protein BGW37DRAFT_468318 [Umbelopsis sp. PMI_123]